MAKSGSHLIVRWFEAGRCGITAAADPGNSNHESGRAVDVDNWPDVIDALETNGWAQTVPGDEVHFGHLASPDLRGSDVLAFQRLWNRNHPEDPIDEDGDFGPATETRLAASPAEGFAIGASCASEFVYPSPTIAIPSTTIPPARSAAARPAVAAAVVRRSRSCWRCWAFGDGARRQVTARSLSHAPFCRCLRFISAQTHCASPQFMSARSSLSKPRSTSSSVACSPVSSLTE